MSTWRLFGDYFIWHYHSAILAWWRIYGNLLWFLYHFFSVSVVVRTLFSPWRRLAENYPRGFQPQAMAETFVVNILLRFVGLVIRLIFLAVAVIILSLSFFAGWLFLAFWLILPMIIIFSFLSGFYLTFLT